MTDLAQAFERERLQPTPRIRRRTVLDDLGDLIHLIVTECLHHDTEGRRPRYFSEGDHVHDYPGYRNRQPH